MKRTNLWISIFAVFFLTIGVVSQAYAVEIGLAWAGKSGMAKRVLKGLEKGLHELAPAIKVEMHKELASIDELATVIKEFEKNKNGMVILRSNGAKWLGANPPSIPTFIGGCNNPKLLKAVKNMKSPEGNVTGVTYYLPVSTQFETFQAILPGMKSVMLLVEKDHPSSVIDQSETKKVTQELGIKYSERICASKKDAISAIKANVDKVSAFILGNQAILIDAAASIVAAAGKTPVLSFSSKPVKEGALGGFVADDETLGYMLAETVVDVLIKGKAVKDVPVKVDPKPKFVINAKTAQNLGIEIPFEVLEFAKVIK